MDSVSLSVSLFFLTLSVFGFSHYFLSKRICKTEEYMSDTNGYTLYKWTIISTPFLAILILLFVEGPFAWILLLITITFTICSVLERKYIPSSRKHIVSLIMVGLSIVAAILFAI